MKKIEIKVVGMHCAHCKARVEQAICAVEGVKSCKANIKKGCAVIAYADGFDPEAAKSAVGEAGFEAP